jgi:chromosome transmission fidelity protein 18
LTAGNFLGIAAQKGKEAKKSARRRAGLGGGVASFSHNQKSLSFSHSGSGLPLNQVVRMKYVKGFTQAVRTPCRWQDLE